jgi:excisionase family DNA binding protein
MDFQIQEKLPRILKQMTKIGDQLQGLVILKKKVLTIEDASFMTGLAVNTLYKYTAEGIIPCYKPNGKKLYFKRKELEAWMMKNRSSMSDLSDDVDDALFNNSRK